MKLRPYQELAAQDALDFVAEARAGSEPRNTRCYVAPTGCHDPWEMVLRSDGTAVPINEIRVGDRLLGPVHNNKVLAILTGREEMFAVQPKRGEAWTATKNHVLWLRWGGRSSKKYKNGECYPITVSEFLQASRHQQSKWKQVSAESVSMPEGFGDAYNKPVRPYRLGVILGDGSTLDGRCIVTTSDVECMKDEGVLWAHPLREDPRSPGCWYYHAFEDEEGLRSLGLWGVRGGQKAVPRQYLRAMIFQRLELLAGLLDSDGYLRKDNSYDFCSESEDLVRDVVFLARSVGLRATKSEKIVKGKVYWRCFIYGEVSIIPCRVPRKQARKLRPRSGTSITIEPLGVRPFRGVTLDGDHLYLLSDFTITHNSGKGTIQLAVHKSLCASGLDSWLLTPSLEIVRGFLDRLGVDTECSGATLAKRAWNVGVATPERFTRRLLKREIPTPDAVIVDEVHEFIEANTNPQLVLACLGNAPLVGYTATPYRASPKQTLAFRDLWGEPRVVLTMADAIAGGWLSFPEFSIHPLVDDDAVTVKNGEFDEAAIGSQYASHVEGLLGLLRGYQIDGKFDKATIVSVPSRAFLDLLVASMGPLAVGVHQGTSTKERLSAYERTKRGEVLLIQISVLTRGADLPFLRRLVDCQPTMSPVRWMQTVGRVTRPGAVQAEVVVTNRNLERHGYLLSGFIPQGRIVEAQNAFGSPSARTGSRDLGLEALGRLKRESVRLANGGYATFYALYTNTKAGRIIDYCAILLPGKDRALWAHRDRTPIEGSLNKWNYAPWSICGSPPSEFVGFKSIPPRPLTDKQREWWDRSAARVGLDPKYTVDHKKFAILPVLRDLGLRIG